MTRTPSWITRLARDYAPIIAEISDERDTDDGVWFYLKPGLCFSEDNHQVHEYDAFTMKSALDRVIECDCGECGRPTREALAFLAKRKNPISACDAAPALRKPWGSAKSANVKQRYLWHVTPKKNVASIKKRGLVPSKPKNKELGNGVHPPLVYVSKRVEAVRSMAHTDYASTRHGMWSVLRIDTKKLPPLCVFYDPRAPDGSRKDWLFTTSKIPASAIVEYGEFEVAKPKQKGRRISPVYELLTNKKYRDAYFGKITKKRKNPDLLMTDASVYDGEAFGSINGREYALRVAGDNRYIIMSEADDSTGSYHMMKFGLSNGRVDFKDGVKIRSFESAGGKFSGRRESPSMLEYLIAQELYDLLRSARKNPRRRK